VAGLRKQLGAAQRVEDELRKQQASAASASKAEERQKNDAIAKLKGTIEQTHAVEVRRLGEEHEVALAARSREVAQLTAQLKSTLQKYQRAQSTLADERDRIREVLLGSRSMAEVSMAFTPEQETKLLHKVEQQVHECSADEMHWLVTKPFRTWLAQSYTECDEVCDALEAEQQRLKRIYHTKEQELTRMRAYATCLRSKIRWCYQVCLLTLAGSIATGCAGAWRAIATGQFWPSVQLMGFAWAVIAASALLLLFGDGSGSPPVPSSPRSPNGAIVGGGGGGLGGTQCNGGGSGGGGGSGRYLRERERRAGASPTSSGSPG